MVKCDKPGLVTYFFSIAVLLDLSNSLAAPTVTSGEKGNALVFFQLMNQCIGKWGFSRASNGQIANDYCFYWRRFGVKNAYTIAPMSYGYHKMKQGRY